MSKRFTYSKTVDLERNKNGFKQLETFTAVEFDSFDEAIKAVEKGIYDRELLLKQKDEENKKDKEAFEDLESRTEEIKEIKEVKTTRPIIKK